MSEATCPKCGHEATPQAPCPGCGHAAVNGPAKPLWKKPPPPPEAADWVITPVPPEIMEWARQTFDEAEFIAALREVERTGGVSIDALIDKLNRKINGSA